MITGHGSYRSGDAKIAVPAGKTFYFYCPHGTPLSNSVGMAVEGFEADSPPAPQGQAVPLSVLLEDSRCARASEIHWAACRSLADWLAPNTHDAGYKLGRVSFAS